MVYHNMMVLFVSIVHICQSSNNTDNNQYKLNYSLSRNTVHDCDFVQENFNNIISGDKWMEFNGLVICRLQLLAV